MSVENPVDQYDHLFCNIPDYYLIALPFLLLGDKPVITYLLKKELAFAAQMAAISFFGYTAYVKWIKKACDTTSSPQV